MVEHVFCQSIYVQLIRIKLGIFSWYIWHEINGDQSYANSVVHAMYLYSCMLKNQGEILSCDVYD